MFPDKRFSMPLLILCSALIFASVVLLWFALSPLSDDRLWLVIFPCILWICAFLPLERAVREHNRTFIERQNALLDAGFPARHLTLIDEASMQTLLKKRGFRDNGRGYLKKHVFSLRERLIYDRSIRRYIRWIFAPTGDLRALIEQEYHDFTCLYDTIASEKRLLLFIRRDEITPADIESLKTFCTALLRDELNLRHALMPIPENTPLPRVQERVYLHAHMILPVLTDNRGTACFVDASALKRPAAKYCTYAEECRMFKHLFSVSP